MLVTWVAWPKLAYHYLPRPSFTASVPMGALQRSRLGLAPALVLPAAAPVAAVALVLVDTMPPGVTQPTRAMELARAAQRKADVDLIM